MKYVIFSDVHSNLEAFESSIESFKTINPDKYLCIGDIVGYGADPSLCISLVQSLKPYVVAGNHDWGVTGRHDIQNFSHVAKVAALWSRGLLKTAELEYLNNLELMFSDDDFVMVHGSLDTPNSFNYLFTENEMNGTFRLMDKHLCFVGHTHIPGIYEYDGIRISRIRTDKFSLNMKCKYIINVGSIGQPRDNNPDASYVVYDSTKSLIEFIRVPYNIKKAQDKIIKNGLPEFLAQRLEIGR